MNISLEFLATVVAIIAVVGPGFYFVGKLTTRVEAIERAHAIIFKKLDALADALHDSVAAGTSPTLHCPLAEDDRCAFRQHQKSTP